MSIVPDQDIHITLPSHKLNKNQSVRTTDNNVAGPSRFNNNFITPEQFTPFKAGPQTNKRKENWKEA